MKLSNWSGAMAKARRPILRQFRGTLFLVSLASIVSVPAASGPVDSVEMVSPPRRVPAGHRREIIAPIGLRATEEGDLAIHLDDFGIGAFPRRYRQAQNCDSGLQLPIALAPQLADLSAQTRRAFAKDSARAERPLSEEMKIAPIPEPTTFVLVGVGLFCFWGLRMVFGTLLTSVSDCRVDV